MSQIPPNPALNCGRIDTDGLRRALAILRTDAAAHRVLPADSELAQAVAVLSRAQQGAVWDRTQAGNKLTSHLRESDPSDGAPQQGKKLNGGVGAGGRHRNSDNSQACRSLDIGTRVGQAVIDRSRVK